MENNPPQKFYWTMVLAEVLFMADGQMQVLKQQFHSKSNLDHYPAQRLKQLQQVAIMQVQQNTQGMGICKDFQPIEVFLLGLVPLGLMSDQEFFARGGMTVSPIEAPGAQETLQDASSAAAETPVAEALAERPSATVHTLRPGSGLVEPQPPGDVPPADLGPYPEPGTNDA